ncbi:MAG: hypothetical protein EA001_15415 [Oscillatoriales cyanobacterium]|nr:MAG: hypothetical protein EA001_15415 [Oscillatoriales cyanobacterium]
MVLVHGDAIALNITRSLQGTVRRGRNQVGYGASDRIQNHAGGDRFAIWGLWAIALNGIAIAHGFS